MPDSGLSLIHISSSNNPMKDVPASVALFHGGGNQGTAAINDLPKVTQRASCRRDQNPPCGLRACPHLSHWAHRGYMGVDVRIGFWELESCKTLKEQREGVKCRESEIRAPVTGEENRFLL